MRRLFPLFLLLGAVAPAAYQPYFTDTFTPYWNSLDWTVSGTGYQATSYGLNISNPYNDVILLSNVTPPGNGADYDVRISLRLASTWVGVYSVYVRAADDLSSYYCVTLDGNTLQYWKVVNNSASLEAAMAVPVRDGMSIRVSAIGSQLTISTDGILRWLINDSDIATGRPGVGGRHMGAADAISRAELGPADTTAPSAVDRAGVRSSLAPTCVDLAWQGAQDDANGTGVMRYVVYRGTNPNNLSWIAEPLQAALGDCAVSPSTTYYYRIRAIDYHQNMSAATDFNLTTPDASAIDPRRIGVHALGAHWGAAPSGSEQIDMRSGNLNFSLPLVKAMGRGGWSVPFGLSYNSQNWRYDGGGVWKLGTDIGYGFGWRVMAGSVTPYWIGTMTVAFYIFTDATGTEYRLDQNSGNVWTSKEGLRASFDANTNMLYFNDGMAWQMGAMAAGTEPDAGALYPTMFLDTNGNRVLVRYMSGVGTNWPDSSGRIHQIEDVRAPVSQGWTYLFGYSGDAVPHLGAISNSIGTSETHQFEYQSRTLCSPFTQDCYGGTQSLTTVRTAPALDRPHYFEYDGGSGSGPGELTRVTFPHTGYLRWTHESFSYSVGRMLREVTWRYFNPSPWDYQPDRAFRFYWTQQAGQTYHSAGGVEDVLGAARKDWFFADAGAGREARGLLQSHEVRSLPVWFLMRKYEYTWNTASTPYVSSVTTTLDNGLKAKTDQTLDEFGNLLGQWFSHYGLGAPGAPLKSQTNTYLNSPAYTSKYVRNRLLTSTVWAGAQSVQVVSNSYDGDANANELVQLPGTPRQWMWPTGPRGNVSQTVSPGAVRNMRHDVTGQTVKAYDDSGHAVDVTSGSATNFAAPATITPNSTGTLTTSLEWSSFLGVTQESGPNGAVARTHYDWSGRVDWTQSVHGATTYYEYNDALRWVRKVTGTQWARTTVDGIGRTVLVESGSVAGYPNNPVWTTVTVRETEYGACACSPLGKVKKVAQPHAPGAAVNWTEYEYDALGRTTKVKHPGGGETRYIYAGNWMEVRDPANKWKSYEQNAVGQLTGVHEPKPGGGTYVTQYEYDALGRLTSVSMPRDGVTQTRTFTYSATTQRLVSATNPETGTVSYVYNNDGTMQSKTDAKGQRIEYSYDVQQRVTLIRRFNGPTETLCDRQKFTYDDENGGWTQNGQGRLVAVDYHFVAENAPTFTEQYSYTDGGLKTKKGIWASTTQWVWSREASYVYDDQGRLTNNDGYALKYDDAGRLAEMRDPLGNLMATAQYGAAGQMTQMRWRAPGQGTAWIQENRTYNARMQMTRQTAFAEGSNAVGMDMEYRFPAASVNNGRIESQRDYATGGEDIVYQYDELNRLITAVTTGPEWGLSFTYDGFGNRTKQEVYLKGSAPTAILPHDANNRVVGWGYDANGNTTNIGTMSLAYDGHNRLSQVSNGPGGSESYGYDPENKRVYRSAGETYLYFYDVFGQRVSTYRTRNRPLNAELISTNVYFAGRLIQSDGKAVVTDRLGSVRARAELQGGPYVWTAVWVERHKYFPYGEENTATASNREKFGTYQRDQASNLDYAMNRYYGWQYGRFMTPDPYKASAGQMDPGSWNRYVYVQGDPVNWFDASGLDKCTVSYDPATSTFRADCGYFEPSGGGTPGGPSALSDRPAIAAESGLGSALPTDGPPYCPGLGVRPTGVKLADSLRKAAEAVKGILERSSRAQAEGLLVLPNVEIALWFAEMVREGGEWDFKRRDRSLMFEDFGNQHYAIVGRFLGFSEDTLLRAAGFVSNAEDLRRALIGRSTVGSGFFLGGAPHGDQASDQLQIRAGFRFFEAMQGGCGWVE